MLEAKGSQAAAIRPTLCGSECRRCAQVIKLAVECQIRRQSPSGHWQGSRRAAVDHHEVQSWSQCLTEEKQEGKYLPRKETPRLPAIWWPPESISFAGTLYCTIE